VLRELVVKLLGTEEGADEVLRRAWARLEAMQLPLGRDAKTMLLTLAEREAWKSRQKTPEPVPMPAVTGGRSAAPADPGTRPS
jgi:hypothetical protein